MADNAPTNTDAGVSTGNQIDSAELERLQGRDKALEKFETEAKTAGHETVDSYIDMLAEQQYKNMTKPKVEPVQPKEPAKPPVDPPVQPVGLSDSDRAAIDLATRNSTQATLDNHYTQYLIEQKDMPKEQQSSYSKRELNVVLGSQAQQAIIQLAAEPGMDGNFYKAAKSFLDVKNLAKPKTDASQEALEAAKNTTTLPDGKAPPVEIKGDGNKSENDTLADDICPDDQPII